MRPAAQTDGATPQTALPNTDVKALLRFKDSFSQKRVTNVL